MLSQQNTSCKQDLPSEAGLLSGVWVPLMALVKVTRDGARREKIHQQPSAAVTRKGATATPLHADPQQVGTGRWGSAGSPLVVAVCSASDSSVDTWLPWAQGCSVFLPGPCLSHCLSPTVGDFSGAQSSAPRLLSLVAPVSSHGFNSPLCKWLSDLQPRASHRLSGCSRNRSFVSVQPALTAPWSQWRVMPSRQLNSELLTWPPPSPLSFMVS